MTAVKIPARRAWAWLGSQSATRTISLLMIAYLLALGFLYHRQNKIVSCQAAYSAASAQSTQGRAAAAEQDRAATDAMVKGIVNATSPAQVHQALVDYLAARKSADEARAQNKVTPAPAVYCR